MAIRNMACQHREFQSRLDDAEKLQLYAQSAVSRPQALDASLAKAESKSKHWKQEAKASAEKIEWAKKEIGEAKKEAKVARLAAGEAKARAEDDLIRARDALAAAEEDGSRLEAEVARQEVERTSLLLELETSKDEVSSLHSQVGKDKKSMEEDYHTTLEQIFSYGYVCCAFKHNICGDQPGITKGMPDYTDPIPPEFFSNLGCCETPENSNFLKNCKIIISVKTQNFYKSRMTKQISLLESSREI